MDEMRRIEHMPRASVFLCEVFRFVFLGSMPGRCSYSR